MPNQRPDWVGFKFLNSPLSIFIPENTAYMIVTAMGMVMYNYLVDLFSSKVDFVEDTFRMKTFRYNFIAVAAEWKGDKLLIHDTEREWEKLAG